MLRRLGAAVAVGLVLAHVVALVLVVKHGAAPMRRARLRAKACLLFIEVAPEERCLTEELYPRVFRLHTRARMLDRLGYLRPPLVKEGTMRELAAAGGGCFDEYGSFGVEPAGAGAYVAAGQARLPHRGGEPADAVVLAYGPGEEEQKVFTLSEVGGSAAWRKTFSGEGLPAQARLTAWAFDAEEGKAYRLCGEGATRPPG